MAINYAPKVGEVLECNFGNNTEDMYNYDGHLVPEMCKNRMVVILNGRLNGGCIIVPISSTQDIGSISRGIHIHLPTDLFRVTNFYDRRDRWAKTDTIRYVSRKRLFKMKDGQSRFDLYLPREVVTEIQRGVIKAISAASLLPA